MEIRHQYRIVYNYSGYSEELFTDLEAAVDRQKERAKARSKGQLYPGEVYPGHGSKILHEIVISEVVPGSIMEGEKAEDPSHG